MQFDLDYNVIITVDEPMIHTISCDEKLRIQAIAITDDGVRPTGKNGRGYLDSEYKRLGTLLLLAGIDLLIGRAMSYVSDTHKSSDIIQLL